MVSVKQHFRPGAASSTILTLRSFSGRYLHSLVISIHWSTSPMAEDAAEDEEEEAEEVAAGGGDDEDGGITAAAVAEAEGGKQCAMMMLALVVVEMNNPPGEGAPIKKGLIFTNENTWPVTSVTR